MSYRVVIAEDELDIRNNLVRLLKLEDYQVWAGANGVEALTLIREHLPDLVVSDVTMPQMSGLELVQTIRSDIQLHHIPTILLTARAEHSDMREAMNLGADDYLVKPYRNKELLAAIRAKIERGAQQKAHHTKLQEISRHLLLFDAATNLPNREHLLERCNEALRPVAGEQAAVVMAVVAFDGLSQATQAYGHAVTDGVLIAMAQRIGETLKMQTGPKGPHMLGRIASDRFAIGLHESEDGHRLWELTGELLAGIALPYAEGGHVVYLTGRIGLARAHFGANANDLLRQAEVALDSTQAHGTQKVALFNAAHDTQLHRRMTLQRELHNAVVRQQLKLYYQPQVSVANRKLVGFESLMRWEHPELGWVSPEEFIPIAEECGLIVSLGAWAMEEACRQSAEWLSQGLPRTCIAINLSTRQFYDAFFFRSVKASLQKHAILPEHIALEITESVAMHGLERTMATLFAFKSMGLGLAIDDFGTGYSSLSYLNRFPLNCLKMDQSFVRNLESSASDAAIARAVVALAHSFGLDVVAEGVETLAQLDMLADMGCNFAQGFYFSKPVPADQAAVLMRDLSHCEFGARHEPHAQR